MESATTIRQKLHNFLEELNDEELQEVYTQHEEEVERKGVEWTDDFKAEMSDRVARFKSGETKAITPEESMRRINALLAKHKAA